MRGTILQVNLSPGGLPKRPVPEAWVAALGLNGDGHAHPEVHGGPRKAVLIIPAENTEELIARGYPLFYGALGENLTTRGLDRRTFRAGQRFRAGEALLELTRLRGPCSSLDVYGTSLKKDLEPAEPGQPAYGLGGFYASVIEPGRVRAGDEIFLLK